jgi:succinate-acetate transporter protein
MSSRPTPTQINTSDLEKGAVAHEEHANGNGGFASPIQLTNAQYERLFFQPGAPRALGGPASARWQPGNPTAFAIISYLLSLTPTVCMLAQWDGAAPTSFPTIVGVFYLIGGLGMTIGAVCEWIMGNTFPFVVFGSFGGFWFSLGVLFDPSKGIPSAFPEGANDPTFNHGLQFYFTFWAVLCIFYLVASLRTNGVFVFVFFTLVLVFAFLAAAYRQAGLGNTALSLTYLKAAGGCGIANILGGWYLFLVLILASVEMPFDLPVGDLSWFLKKRQHLRSE